MSAGQAGEEIEASGTLVREGGGFALRLDEGGLLALDLHRVPVDHVEKPVRVRGRMVTAHLLEVDGITAN